MLRDHPCATRNVFPAVAVGFCLFGIIFSEVKGEAVASMYGVTYPKREDPAFRVSVRVFTVEHRHFIDRVVLATQQFYLFELFIGAELWLIEFLSIDCSEMQMKTRASLIGQKFENRSERWKQREITFVSRSTLDGRIGWSQKMVQPSSWAPWQIFGGWINGKFTWLWLRVFGFWFHSPSFSCPAVAACRSSNSKNTFLAPRRAGDLE